MPNSKGSVQSSWLTLMTHSTLLEWNIFLWDKVINSRVGKGSNLSQYLHILWCFQERKSPLVLSWSGNEKIWGLSAATLGRVGLEADRSHQTELWIETPQGTRSQDISPLNQTTPESLTAHVPFRCRGDYSLILPKAAQIKFSISCFWERILIKFPLMSKASHSYKPEENNPSNRSTK